MRAKALLDFDAFSLCMVRSSLVCWHTPTPTPIPHPPRTRNLP